MSQQEPEDIGDILHVPEDQRLDVDDTPDNEVNEDEFQTDFSDVPDGEVVELSTAHLDDDELDGRGVE